GVWLQLVVWSGWGKALKPELLRNIRPRLIRNSTARRVAAVLLASLVCGSGASADDWPQWLGPQRDDVWRETGIVGKFPQGGPPVRWRTPIGGGYTGPAVADGRVYVMDRQLPAGAKPAKQPSFMNRPKQNPGSERVLCLNETDGKLLWKHEYDCPYTVQYDSGPRTTPLVHDRKVYTLGTEGNLFCLDSEHEGKMVWAHDFKKDYGAKTPFWGFAAHPLLDGNKLICMVGGEGSAVVAFDKDTGKEMWKGLTARELGYCPAMIYEAGGMRQLIVCHGAAIHGL